MRDTTVKTAKELDNLLQSEVVAMDMKVQGNLHEDWIEVIHFRKMDYNCTEEIYCEIENEVCMVLAYLKKNLLFGLDDDELLKRTAFLQMGDDKVGFAVDIGRYYP